MEDEDDLEGHVLACCVSVAIEEVEKWMYKGDFTPSVAPFREGQDFKLPELPVNISQPVNQRGSIIPDMGKLKAWNKIKNRGKPVVVVNPSPLDNYTPDRWDHETSLAFKNGNRALFLSLIANSNPPSVTLKQASDYLSRMMREYPHLWAAANRHPKDYGFGPCS
jgi:hypothetical protein